MSSRRQKLRRSMKQQRRSLKRRNKTKSRTPKRSARRIMRGGVSRKRALAATAVAAGVLATPFIFNKMKTGKSTVTVAIPVHGATVATPVPVPVDVNQVGVYDAVSGFLSIPYKTILDLFSFFYIVIPATVKQNLTDFFNLPNNSKKKYICSILPGVSARIKNPKFKKTTQFCIRIIECTLKQTDVDIRNVLELIYAWYLLDCFFTTLLLYNEFNTDPQFININIKEHTAEYIYWICHYYNSNNQFPTIDAIMDHFRINTYESNLLLAAATKLLTSTESIDKARLQCIFEKYSATND